MRAVAVMSVVAAGGVAGAQAVRAASAGERPPGGPSASGPAADERPDPRLARFHNQKLTWHKCQLDKQDDLGKSLDAINARCAEVTVPLDYREPGGRTITVAISRRPATDRARRLGTLMINTGGPGESISGSTWVVRGEPGFFVASGAPEVAARYDLVAMDPRFHHRSSPLECGWPGGLVQQAGLAAVDRAAFDRGVAVSRDLAARCVSQQDLLPHASTRNIARDMDVARAVLGERKVSYLGWSYGGYLGAVYTQMFPHRADRVVLDSAPNPDAYGATWTRDLGLATAAGLKTWAAWAAARDAQYHLGTTTAQVLAVTERIRSAATRGRLRIGEHQVPAGAAAGVLSSLIGRERFFPQATEIMRKLHDAARGIVVTDRDLEQYLASFSSAAIAAGVSAFEATSCADRPGPRGPEAYWRDIQDHRADEPVFGPLFRMITPCAFWPTDPAEPPTRINNRHPVLIAGATGDTTTPYSGQLVMHRAQSGSRMLTLAATVAHGAYLFEGNTCLDSAVNRYLLTGARPNRDTICPKDKPTPQPRDPHDPRPSATEKG